MADQTKAVEKANVETAKAQEETAPGAADHSGVNLTASEDGEKKKRSGGKLPPHVQRAFDEGGSVLTHHTEAGSHTATSEDELPDGWEKRPKAD